jgi:hypothetical protein
VPLLQAVQLQLPVQPPLLPLLLLLAWWLLVVLVVLLLHALHGRESSAFHHPSASSPVLDEFCRASTALWGA